MKKIFFIFAMMLMSVVSALAEESSEEFSLNEYKATYSGAHFTITGDECDEWGMYINNGRRFTIRSENGEKITRVKFVISYGEAYAQHLQTTAGKDNVDAKEGRKEGYINNVNATSLEIYSDVGENNCFQIGYLVVYYEYELKGDHILDEYVQTETFATTSGDWYIGNNIIVQGFEGDADGLLVNSSKSLQIRSNNNSLVKIQKVDLEFSSDVDGNNGNLYSTAGGDIDGSGKNWSISNINESSILITYDGGNAYVKNIKVHYLEVVDENTVIIEPTTGDKEYSEGCITVTGTNSSFQFGLGIDKGDNVTISSDDDVEILRVDLHLSYYYGSKKIESTAGTVAGSDENWTISGINSSNLTISHPGRSVGDAVSINKITVHYRKLNAPSTILVTAKKAEVAYWSTFYSSIANYQAPEGTKVYKVNDDGSFITTTEIEDRIVTKGQGVVLKSLTSGNIVMTKVASGSSDDYSGNSLTGTGVAITNPGNAYVLNYKPSSGVGFYKLSSTGTIGANKAYLVSDNVAARAFFAFDIDATTGIDKVNALDSEKEVKAFDLQGRRVANPAKGIYIVNGKKVIMK